MNYSQFKTKQQKEVNAFPMEFAFSEQQFAEVREKLGPGKLIRIGGTGGFIRAEDKNALQEMWDKHKREMKEFLSDDCNLIDAIRYELRNHEFCITGDPTEACNALALDPVTDPRVASCLRAAIKLERW